MLPLDTPAVFEHYSDLQVVQYNSKDTARKEIIFSAKADAKGRYVNTLSYGYLRGGDCKTAYRYDSKGNLAESISYSRNVKDITRTVYAYSAEKNLLKKELFILKTNEATHGGTNNSPRTEHWKKTETFSYKYDKTGKISELRHEDDAAQNEKTVYEYDNKGRISRKKQYRESPSGELKEKAPSPVPEIISESEYQYTNDGYAIKTRQKGAGFDYIREESFKLNSGGKPEQSIARWQFDMGANMPAQPMKELEKCRYEYDGQGRLSKKVSVIPESDFIVTRIFIYSNKDIPEFHTGE